MELTIKTLKGCLPNAKQSDIDKYFVPLKNWMKKFNIDTPLRIAHFLAQVGTESGDLKWVRELGNSAYFKKYDTGKLAKNLGNTPEADGDGELYKGRGLIQITGKANYTLFSKFYFGEGEYEKTFVEKPELVETPTPAVASAIWFWNNRNLNKYADLDDVLKITKLINGGTNGLEQRKKRLETAKKYLGLQ